MSEQSVVIDPPDKKKNKDVVESFIKECKKERWRRKNRMRRLAKKRNRNGRKK